MKTKDLSMATKLFTVECEDGDTTYYMERESNGVTTIYSDSKVIPEKKSAPKSQSKSKTPKKTEKPKSVKKTVKKTVKEKVVKATKAKTTKKSKTDIDDLLE